MSSLIVFVEVPRFYAEVEASIDPLLRTVPFVVGGNPYKRGRVQSASAGALALGVGQGMLLIEALDACPRIRIVRTNMKRYRDVSKRLRAFFRGRARRTDLIGFSAAHLDFGLDDKETIEKARALVGEVWSEFGLPVRIGVSPVKFVAMLVAREEGDDPVKVILPSQLREFLDPLEVTYLPGVGPRTKAKLAQLGIVKVADVLSTSKERLLDLLGKQGAAIHASALGVDREKIRSAPHARSVSQEHTLPEPELDMIALRELLGELSGRLAQDLQLEGLMSGRVSLKASYRDGETVTRTKTLRFPIVSREAILEIGEELLFRTDAGVRSLRLVGLALAELTRPNRVDSQLELF